MLGRPPLSQNTKDLFVRKLEPYLKLGLSVRKACYQANIPHSTVYDLIIKDPDFSDRIEGFKTYKSIMVTDLFMLKLEELSEKAHTAYKLRHILKSKQLPSKIRHELNAKLHDNTLKPTELAFLQWLAVNDKSLRDEFGSKTELVHATPTSITGLLDSLELRTDYTKFAQDAAQELQRQI